jgi:hypothetical protein
MEEAADDTGCGLGTGRKMKKIDLEGLRKAVA